MVAVNRRPEDSDDEIGLTRKLALEYGAHAAEVNDGFARGGEGAAELAQAVVDASELGNDFHWITKTTRSRRRSRRSPGASTAPRMSTSSRKPSEAEAVPDDGLGHLPICMAKTHLSLSADPELLGAPAGFTLPVRDVRAYTGAGWVVPVCGNVLQMPGLGRQSAAVNVDINDEGVTVGLF